MMRTLFARRMRPVLAALWLVSWAATSAAAPAAAQTAPAATLTGTVVDTAGKPLGAARVSVTSANITRVTRSGLDGRFSIALPPDTYTVSAAVPGFESGHVDGVTVVPGSGADVKVSLANATLQTIGRTSGNRATSVNTTTAATTVVSSQTFADQGQNQVVNVLDQIPGVEINRVSSNAPGSNTSISIRGAEPYESQILIDGHPVVGSANGAHGFNATFVNSLLLGDVEVNKGPGSLPNTVEDAVGGTLNFKTPSISGGPTGSALFGYDSYDAFYYGIKASDTFGKLGVLLGVGLNQTPGYLPAGATLYSGSVDPAVTAGTAFNPHVGVVNFGYAGSQYFTSHSQLGKISYNFSPQTSLLLTQYSTQTTDDETGTNYQYVNATILPCIDTPPTGFTGTPNCSEAGGSNPNYTSPGNLHVIGQNVPINLYAPYPNTSQFDNAPIYSAEFRTVLGPGSFLARYYTGAINRIITQNYASGALNPCATPACPPVTSGDNPNVYDSAPYVEDTIDKLNGVDAQYSVPFGANAVTLGFDRHVDTATFGAFDPTQGPPTFPQDLPIQSIAYSIRGDFALTRKLTLESGNYVSSTTYVGKRFDPRDGLVYHVNNNATVRASYGSAYVAPYYSLINPSSYAVPGTLNLATGAFKPETSSGYDIGTDFNLGRTNLISFDGYLTNIYNRYASVTVQQMGTFEGTPYSQITQEGNQADVRQEGLEFQFLHAPRTGVGFHTAVDLLRAYAHGQNPNVGIDSIFSATPADNVQLPSYPYSKIRNDLFYTFNGGAQARISGTSYGANNAFGQPGFTLFDAQIRLPVEHGLTINIGGTNIFNHDDYRAGGIYDGGYTFPVLGGGSSYTTLFFAQPRTLYIQLERRVGPGGAVQPSRAPL